MKKNKPINIKVITKIAWMAWIISFIVFFVFAISLFSRYSSSKQHVSGYLLSWPGILPDNKLYKIKVLRNKIIEKMIVSPVNKVEFDLLMADKTIYASKLLVEKGDIALAKDTVLKGENYYSMLAQDYKKALLKGKKIPKDLDKNITLAAMKHQEIFMEMENVVNGEDKKTFQIVSKFSKINYEFIVGLRNPKKD